MKNKDCDIPTSIKVLGWCLIGIVILYFCKEFLGYPSAKEFLEGQGSLIAGGIALIAAMIALCSQREATQKQIDAQKSLEEARLIRAKIEEMYGVVSGLRLKILFIEARIIKELIEPAEDLGDSARELTKIAKDVISSIDAFNYDFDKILMLYNLYGNSNLYESFDRELFSEYRGSTRCILDSLKKLTKKSLI